MSTQINVTVDSGGLSERARQQVTANRQAKLEADQRKQLEAKAAAGRQAERAAADQSGKPARKQAAPDEPAAHRRGGAEVILHPLSAVQGTTAIPPLTSPEGIAATALDTSYRYVEPTGNWYAVNGLDAPGQFTGAGVLSAFSPVQEGFSIQAPGIYNSEFILQTLGRSPISWAPSRRFTLEAWFYLPFCTGEVAVWRPSIGISARVASATTQPQRTLIEVGYRQLFQGDSAVLRGGNVLAADSTVGAPDNLVPYAAFSGFDTTVSLGAWTHCAIVFNGVSFKVYTNGQFKAAVTPGQEPGVDLSPMMQSYQDVVPYVAMNTSGAAFPGDTFPDAYVRGVRYTPRVRYPEAGFTPVHY